MPYGPPPPLGLLGLTATDGDAGFSGRASPSYPCPAGPRHGGRCPESRLVLRFVENGSSELRFAAAQEVQKTTCPSPGGSAFRGLALDAQAGQCTAKIKANVRLHVCSMRAREGRLRKLGRKTTPSRCSRGHISHIVRPLDLESRGDASRSACCTRQFVYIVSSSMQRAPRALPVTLNLPHSQSARPLSTTQVKPQVRFSPSYRPESPRPWPWKPSLNASPSRSHPSFFRHTFSPCTHCQWTAQ